MPSRARQALHPRSALAHVGKAQNVRPLGAVLRARGRVLRRRRADPVQKPQRLPQVRAAAPRQERRKLAVDPLVRGGQVARRLPHVLLRHGHETAGERIAVEVAPDRDHAFVLGVVAHAIQLVQNREQVAPPVRIRIALARRDPDAHDQIAPPEADVGKMAGQVHHHAAAGAAAEAEDHADDRLRSARVNARRKAPQRPLHRALAVVVRPAVDRLRRRARERSSPASGSWMFDGSHGS